MRTSFKVAALAAVPVLALSSFASASTPAFAITLPFEVAEVAEEVVTVGGAALLIALACGAGFRIAKKSYSWIMGKV